MVVLHVDLDVFMHRLEANGCIRKGDGHGDGDEAKVGIQMVSCPHVCV